MSDADGHMRRVHTPLVSHIADLPKQRLIAGVAATTSPLSLATTSQFGDAEKHPRRLRAYTIEKINEACTRHDPLDDLERFVAYCKSIGYIGVVRPYWIDYGDANPPDFLTPDALHAFHKFFKDHPYKWVENIIGASELDYHLSVLQPQVGQRNWPHGVSKLKQLTGREHHELEKIIVAVAGDTLQGPVMCTIHALLDFIFQAQNLLFTNESIHALTVALDEFHHYKNTIIVAGGRRGTNGIISHFRIPKLELMHGVAESVRLLGAPYQWSSDVTERCHITHVKQPYRFSNRRDFHSQCVRYLDHIEKAHLFDLYVRLKSRKMSLLNEMATEAGELATNYPEAEWMSHVLPDENILQIKHINFFANARSHVSSGDAIAILLTACPHHKKIAVEDTAGKFNIPDLRAVLGDYIDGYSYDSCRGARRSKLDCPLPFTHLDIWLHFRLQRCSTQDPRVLLPPRTVQALPPTEAMPYGRCDTILITTSESFGAQTSELSSTSKLETHGDPTNIY